MKYDHMVKVNGEYYPAGTDVPDIKKEKAVEETLPLYSDADIALETKESVPKYSKTEIMRMTTAELQDLAMSIGINGANEMTGGTLKKLLVEHFGL